MSNYMKMAEDFQETRYTGEHEDVCYMCDEQGGIVLRCDLCTNVLHPGCLLPPLGDDEAEKMGEYWVCDSCINDLCTRKEVEREDVEREYPLE